MIQYGGRHKEGVLGGGWRSLSFFNLLYRFNYVGYSMKYLVVVMLPYCALLPLVSMKVRVAGYQWPISICVIHA